MIRGWRLSGGGLWRGEFELGFLGFWVGCWGVWPLGKGVEGSDGCVGRGDDRSG